jgi:thioredoxin-related protein
MGIMSSKWLFIIWLGTGVFSGACGRTEETARTEPSPEAKVAPRTEAPSETKATWLANFEEAQALARSEKKLLLIEFTGSDWCPPCIMLGRQVFSQPEFKNYAAQHLVLLEVDFPRMKELSPKQKAANAGLAERFDIYGFPTVIILDSDGKKIGQLGYMPGGPKPFIAALEELRTKG